MAGRELRAMSFGAVAAEYDRLRPAPPEDAVDWLVPERCGVAVDVAAGTGLLTRALARRVPQVVAVEPDVRMRAVLSARSPQVSVVEGRGEVIPLAEASADGVFVSSAWHWMDPERAVPEIGRVLRDGGRFAVIWTSRDRAIDWVCELDRVVASAPTESSAAADAAAEARRRRHRDVTLPEGALFGEVSRASFGFTRMMTISDVVGMFATYSGVITAGREEKAAGLARARAALTEWFSDAGDIAVPMRAWCWRAERVNRAGHGKPVTS